MSAQIIQFPTKKKVALRSARTNGSLSDGNELFRSHGGRRGMDETIVCRLKALIRASPPGEFDAKPDLRLTSEVRDDLDERLHRFWLKRGIIRETDR